MFNFILVYKTSKSYIDLVRVGTNPHPTLDLLYNTKIYGIDSESPESTWSSLTASKYPMFYWEDLLAKKLCLQHRTMVPHEGRQYENMY